MYSKQTKNSKNQGYSHLLVKNIEEPIEQTHQGIVPSYQPIFANNSKRVSSKIARCSYMPNTNHRELAIVVTPFSHSIEDLQQQQNIIECSFCKSKVCPHSKIENHTVMKCFCCGKDSSITATDSFVENSWGYKYTVPEDIKQENKEKKRTLFVIEASQYIFETNVHNAIFNCLSALQDPNIEAGFVLYDNQSIILIDGETLEVTKVKISDNETWNEFPISIQELFVSIKTDLSEFQELIEYFLYEAFFIKQTVLKSITKVLESLPIDIEVKTFLTTLNDKFNIESTPNPNIFKEKQNKLIPFVEKQSKPPSKQTFQPNFVGNQEFYLIPYNANFKQAIQMFGYGVFKVYNTKEIRNIEKELYYDLFDAVNKNVVKCTQIIVRTEKDVKMQFNKNNASTIYGNLKLNSQTNSYSNKYIFELKRADPSFSLHLRFKSETKDIGKSIIQIEYNYRCGTRVILNLKAFQARQQLQKYDDQLVFGNHLRQCVQKWSGENYKDLKEQLKRQTMNTVAFLKDYAPNGSISFPKNWKHYLLYSYILEDRINKGMLNHHKIYQYLTMNLEQFSKKMYLRTYRLDEDEKIKNIKSAVGMCEKYRILFIDNGDKIFMVLNDPSVQITKKLFGYYDSVSSLSHQHPELPILNTNEPYRNAIETIRNSHQHNFLPLKIVDFDSYIYTEQIEPLLYQKQEHMVFLRKTWKYC